MLLTLTIHVVHLERGKDSVHAGFTACAGFGVAAVTTSLSSTLVV